MARPPRLTRCLLTLLTVAVASMAFSAEWKEKVLYSFQGGTDGATPAGGVVFDKAGNLYGATMDGGSSSCPSPQQCGTVYQLSPPAQHGGAWTETVLYVFQGHNQNDGASPEGGLVIDKAGNLYGTTAYGGTGSCILLGTAVGCGTVFELSPPAKQGDPWIETVLYSFQGGNDGYVPSGDLVFDKAGTLYGATMFGGGKGTTCDPFYQYCGTVFELSPPKSKGGSWTEKVLHSFAGGTDGANPNGGLALDSTGVLYGTTQIGGDLLGECSPNGCGLVFRLERPLPKSKVWRNTTIHQFNGEDGAAPFAGVTLGENDALYGTTSAGARADGLIYELKRPSARGKLWTELILHAFGGNNDGQSSMSGVRFDSSGNLYGTALGGNTHQGVVFRLRPPTQGNHWTLGIVFNFQGAVEGNHPTASLTFDGKGNLYSTTDWGGTGQLCQGGCGTVFELLP